MFYILLEIEIDFAEDMCNEWNYISEFLENYLNDVYI